MRIREDVPLLPLTTFRMGPVATYLIEIKAPEEIPEALRFTKDKGLPFLVLGGGSNTIFTETVALRAVVLHVMIPGFEVVSETETQALVRVGAGEPWDDVVARGVELGLSGIEAMSAIPGSAGATPIQNVGAYGQEIADTLVEVAAYDYVAETFVTLPAAECRFRYRDSRFKHERRHIITAIALRLSKGQPQVPQYPGVAFYFEEKGVADPSLSDIREAIIEIRKKKLPDPKEIASVGSFFKNPIVGSEVVDRLREEFEKPVIFELGDGRYKVGAGWLIDMLGLKGKSFGKLSLYPHNALVLVNEDGATFAELDELVRHLQHQVADRFGITIEPEPVFV